MDVWVRVLSAVRNLLSQQSYDTWFRPIIFASRDQNSIHLMVPNEDFRRCLLENYSELLADAVRRVSSPPLTIDISVEAQPTSAAASPTNTATETPAMPFPLNPRYTFDSFVVGASNQLAHAAAVAVAEHPARAYNPLYIYGGAGLGKTHLMHAIGCAIRQRNSRLRVVYVSSEQFMNEVVNALRYDRALQFRQQYRNIDVLLMDDIQFLAGKERTQQEFFHIFNALYDAQKQIAITGDCLPRNIPTLEERLHSRFEWGLIADIQPPDLETKIAILRKKAAASLIELPDTVIMYIASSIRSNIRELEGALTRLLACSSLEGISPSQINVQYAKQALKDLVVEDKHAVSPETVIRAVSTYYSLKPMQLRSKNNSPVVSRPRQIAMYICKQLTRLSLPQIAREFGGKHHTTVLHSIRKIESLKTTNSEISAALDKIAQSLR